MEAYRIKVVTNAAADNQRQFLFCCRCCEPVKMCLAAVRDDLQDGRPRPEILESTSICNCASESSNAAVDWVESDLLNMIDFSSKLSLGFWAQKGTIQDLHGNPSFIVIMTGDNKRI